MSEQNPHACSDGCCVLLVPGVPVGMHTNGGCRCLSLRMTPNTRVRVRQGIRWLAERVPGAVAPTYERHSFETFHRGQTSCNICGNQIQHPLHMTIKEALEADHEPA